MTGPELLLLIVSAIAAGQTYYLWLTASRRPAWWRRLDLHQAERVILERFDGLERNLTKVMAGLYEDIDGLRHEIRAQAQLPPETQVPRIARDLRRARLVGVIALGVALLALVIVARAEIARAGGLP